MHWFWYTERPVIKQPSTTNLKWPLIPGCPHWFKKWCSAKSTLINFLNQCRLLQITTKGTDCSEILYLFNLIPFHWKYKTWKVPLLWTPPGNISDCDKSIKLVTQVWCFYQNLNHFTIISFIKTNFWSSFCGILLYMHRFSRWDPIYKGEVDGTLFTKWTDSITGIILGEYTINLDHDLMYSIKWVAPQASNLIS